MNVDETQVQLEESRRECVGKGKWRQRQYLGIRARIRGNLAALGGALAHT